MYNEKIDDYSCWQEENEATEMELKSVGHLGLTIIFTSGVLLLLIFLIYWLS